MHHCLYQRNHYALPQTDEQEEIQKELQTWNRSTSQKHKSSAYTRRRTPLSRIQKRERAIRRGDEFWTPGCGQILKISEY